MSEHEATNPFHIGVYFNDKMECWEVRLMVGNINSKDQAKKFAESLSEWIKEDSPSAWSQRVS